MRKSHENCSGDIWRKMFVLDDGYSWVVVERGGIGQKGTLFRVDEETEYMRRQSREEMRVSEWFLEKEKGRFLEYDEGADYMALVRYVEKKKVEKGKKNVYLEKIERESIELVKLQCERLEARKLEERRIEERMLEERKLEMELSRRSLTMRGWSGRCEGSAGSERKGSGN
jgi:hypothetical protein